MKDVYTLSDPMKAHMLVHRLEQEGIKAEIYGEHLLGAIGGLPVAGLIRIAVADADFEEARSVIQRLEADESSQRPEPHKKTGRRFDPVMIALIGALIVTAIVGIVCWAQEQDMKSMTVFSENKLFKPIGRTPLMDAVVHGQMDVVSTMTGTDINAKDSTGDTALILAARYGVFDIAIFLIEHGAVIDAKNNFGETALAAAALHGQTRITNSLLDHGAAIEAIDKWGRTPLMLAGMAGRKESAALLLQRGADIEAKDLNGNTASRLARTSKKSNLATTLFLEEEQSRREKK